MGWYGAVFGTELAGQGGPPTGGMAPLGSKAAAASALEPPSKDSRQALAVPHQGHVSLDRVGHDQWQLSHLLTRERRLLPKIDSGEFHIMFDSESGMGFVYQEAGGEVEGLQFDVDEVFQTALFEEVTTGERWAIPRGGQPVSVDAEAAQHREATVDLSIGPTNAGLKMQVYVFKVSRAARQRVFWPFQELYKAMSLQSHKGFPSSWVSHGLSRWGNMLQMLTGTIPIVHSNHGNTSERTAGSLRWPDRCLPLTSVSTLGLLLILQRFAFASVQQGGFRCDSGRRSAAEILDSFLTHHQEFAPNTTLKIELVANWVCRYPRPADFSASSIELRITKGVLDFGELFRRGGTLKGDPIARSWWVALKKSLRLEPDMVEVPLRAFLEAGASVKVLATLITQVLWHISCRLEEAFGASAQNLPSPEKKTVSFKWTSLIVLLASQTDAKLGDFILSTGQATAHTTEMTLSTDKANVAGLPLQNSFISTPNGIAFPCAPQVGLGLCGRWALLSRSRRWATPHVLGTLFDHGFPIRPGTATQMRLHSWVVVVVKIRPHKGRV